MRFQHGQMSRIAQAAGISIQYLSDLWAGRKRATPETAMRLEDACRAEGLPLHRDIWMYPEKFPRERIGEERSNG